MSNRLHQPEQSRHLFMNYLAGSVAMVFLFGFSIFELSSRHILLGSLLLFSMVLVLLNLFYLYRTGNTKGAALGNSVIIVMLFIYLLATGTPEQTGLLWCYPLTALLLFLLGFRWGGGVVALLLIVSLVFLYVPGLQFVTADYPEAFKAPFIASYLVFGIMASIYEYLRWRNQLGFQAIREELERAARTDPLTQLANRREMLDQLEREYGRFVRHGEQFSILMIDLDNFKQINDNYGHACGDKLLQETSRLFIELLRKQDSVARWGGEEFLVLLPTTGREEAAVVADKLRLKLSQEPFSFAGQPIRATASIGVDTVDRKEDVLNFVDRADSRLYEAKRQGKNRVVASAPVYPMRIGL